MGVGIDRSDWRERQVVMRLAKEPCEDAGGLAGGEKSEC